MTRTAPDRTWDPIRFQRGTRGFAAFWTAIQGVTLLGIALVIGPAAALPAPMDAWIVGLSLTAGIAHLVAVVGLARGRAWGRDLTLYLAAAGIGAAMFSLLLLTRSPEAVLGASGGTAIAYFGWLVAVWAVAARFAYKGYATPADARPLAAIVAVDEVVTSGAAKPVPAPTSGRAAAPAARRSIPAAA